MNRKTQIILDSGAFSVWNKGKEINIDDYISFIKKHKDIISYAVALDVIPGKPNKPLTLQDREEAAKQSKKNYFYMLKKGISEDILIPVFHQGENPKWLEKMVNYSSYIGISPANDKTTDQKRMWMENVCSPFILKKDRSPKIKFHGFAVTSFSLVKEYPWYSVDSATWLRGAINSYIHLPTFKQKKWDFTSDRWIIFLGTKLRKQHIKVCSPEKIKLINKWITDNNKIIEQTCTNYKDRNYLNFIYFLKFEKQVERTTFYFAGAEKVNIHIKKEDLPFLLKRQPSFLITFAHLDKQKFTQVIKELKGDI